MKDELGTLGMVALALGLALVAWLAGAGHRPPPLPQSPPETFQVRDVEGLTWHGRNDAIERITPDFISHDTNVSLIWMRDGLVIHVYATNVAQ